MIWPVSGFIRDSPASLTVTPCPLATRYTATNELNGLSNGVARYTCPWIDLLNNGVSIVTVPSFEPSGQAGSPSLLSPICAQGHDLGTGDRAHRHTLEARSSNSDATTDAPSQARR